MAELDSELLERAARWCAEAGRTATPAALRRALSSLGWDELLTVRALLADPPPARPLGPYALADLARGTSAEVAAERERDSRYPQDREDEPEDRKGEPAAEARAEEAPPPPRRKGRERRARRPGIVIRRAREAEVAAPPPQAAAPRLDELLLPEGRAVVERLLRRHGARRKALLEALAAFRTPAGEAPGDGDLARLLDHHGLARAFARRERDEILHAVRAARGVLATAASRVGMDRAALEAALERLGAQTEAENIRAARRAVLRRRGTLAERAKLVLSEAEMLEDLGILSELVEDLRARLPELVRALQGAGAPLTVALAHSLSLTSAEARTLAERFALRADAKRPPGSQRPSPRKASPSASAPASPSRTRPRPRTSRRSASSSSGRSNR